MVRSCASAGRMTVLRNKRLRRHMKRATLPGSDSTLGPRHAGQDQRSHAGRLVIAKRDSTDREGVAVTMGRVAVIWASDLGQRRDAEAATGLRRLQTDDVAA